jgi:hypothetical protein
MVIFPCLGFSFRTDTTALPGILTRDKGPQSLAYRPVSPTSRHRTTSLSGMAFHAPHFGSAIPTRQSHRLPPKNHDVRHTVRPTRAPRRIVHDDSF